jgi:hypothetical protein
MSVATKAARKTAKKRGGKRPGVRFIVNSKGEKTEVVLPIAVYRKLVEQAEELEDVRAFDEAMKDPDTIPWEEAKKQLGL